MKATDDNEAARDGSNSGDGGRKLGRKGTQIKPPNDILQLSEIWFRFFPISGVQLLR